MIDENPTLLEIHKPSRKIAAQYLKAMKENVLSDDNEVDEKED